MDIRRVVCQYFLNAGVEFAVVVVDFMQLGLSLSPTHHVSTLNIRILFHTLQYFRSKYIVQGQHSLLCGYLRVYWLQHLKGDTDCHCFVK